MRTKLGAFCDKLIESGFLAAIVVLPMIFNVYTESVFKISRVCLLRSITLLMALAWVIGALERRTGKPELGFARRMAQFLKRPLVLPALVIAIVYILTSLTSIWPHGSFWGSYDRHQGIYTTLSYVAIFLLALQIVRSQRQLERLVMLIVFASLPVCIYAFIQYYELVPRPWSELVQGRVPASFGNPIFLAAYLIMVIPVTARQLIRSFLQLRGHRGNRTPMVVSLIVYALVLVAQLFCLVLTQSRGPFLGLLVGVSLFLLLLAATRGQKRWGLVVIGLALLLSLFLIILNLPNTPLAPLKDLPYVGRLGTLAEATTLKTRALIWQGAVRMSTTSPVRALLGYGPETTYLAFFPYLSPELTRFEGPTKTADRTHNATLDALVTTGLVGVMAYLFLFGSVFYYGFKWLGLIQGRRQRMLFIALLSTGGILGGLIPWLLDGALGFAGLGISIGLVAALFVYLVFFLLHNQVIRNQERESKGAQNQVLFIAMFSAIVAHFMEIQTGIAITVTQLYFWVYVALMANVGLSAWEEGKQSRSSNKQRARRKGQFPLLPRALLLGLLLITLIFAFVTRDFSLRSNHVSIMLILLVWLFGVALFVTGENGRPEQQEHSALLTYALVSMGCLFIFIPCHVATLLLSPAPAGIATTYYVSFLLVVVAVALTLLMNEKLLHRFWQQSRWWLYSLLTVIVMVIIVRTNLNLVRADMYSWLGQAYREADRWDGSIAAYEQAVKLAPSQDRYYHLLGHAYLKKAQPVTEQRPFWFKKAGQAIEQAKEISPLDPDHYGNLGNLYHTWADVTDEPAEKAERLKAALSNYQQARRMAPSAHGELLKESTMEAHVSLARSYVKMEEIDLAIEELEAAKALAPAKRKAELDDLIAELKKSQQ